MSEKKCSVCQKEARQFCAACKVVFYCSKECQKQDWKSHKPLCHPFTIQNHPVYGRYMVASRDIKAGEIFLKEAPLAIGPKLMSAPLCLGCHKKLSALTDAPVKCDKCDYPLCSKMCQNSKLHKDECSILEKSANKLQILNYDGHHPAYECITPLRCALLKNKDSKKWEILLKLQSHEEDIKNTDLYKQNDRNVVEYLRKFIGLNDLDAGEMHKICGILATNGFELMVKNNRIKGIYYQSSFLAHDCVPNTKHSFDDDLNIIFRTTINVPKGTALTNTYSQTLWNTLARRHQLKTTKFFLCSCKRCEDPSELETNFSTLLCSECGGNVQSVDPLVSDSEWQCLKCGHSLSGRQVFWGDQQMYRELTNIGRKTPAKLESFMERYKKALHPNHRFFVETKYALVKYYGNFPDRLYRELSQEQLENKVEWCRELLTLADSIDPGKSLFRGNVLMELQAGLVGLAKYLISNDLITEEAAGEYMTEAVGYLQEASEILKHEPYLANGALDDKLSWLSKELDL